MRTLTLVTSNEEKRQEWQRLVPPSITLETIALELDELQSLDPEVVTGAKARAAFAQVGRPVVVEDVSAGLDKLGGLPGPFIKYFHQKLGYDALYQLAAGDPRTTVVCTIGYYDGRRLRLVRGEVHGRVGPFKGGEGFGFDYVFVPDGHAKTFSEMAPAEKDRLSHRGRAVRAFLKQLKEL